MADSEAETKCGFCMREGKGMEEPKILPCKHVHCLECLSDFYVINHLIQCPIEGCREVYEIPAANLPSYSTEDKDWCDVCVSKEQEALTADMYCTDCRKKYCVKHKGTHDDIHIDHTSIDIKEYKLRKRKIDIRTCDKHEEHPYSLGCKVCLMVICNRCFSGLTKCQGEKSHQLLPLDELVTYLENSNRFENIMEREVDLEKLFKLISKCISDFDIETVKMLRSLNATRDVQLAEIKQKYGDLERQFMADRQRTKTKLAEYMESTLMSKWNSVRNTRHRLEAKCKYSHEVDMVRAYDELYKTTERLRRERLPSLKLSNIQEIEKKVTRNVKLYDLSGKLMSSWPSAVNSSYSSLTLVSDQLLLTDQTSFQSTPALYTLNGVRVKNVLDSMKSSLRILMAADNTSIVAFDSIFKDLIKIDLNTEEVMWRKKETELPAITGYGRGHALLADSGWKLRVLNLETG
ncbi:tripartite motif-containing protein 59-like [Watersipora subatra]|uniref:tripartite motif-containing protein 59-like n=1 Tax=Watersipora subatra TaxID=2589382 RepID=UPI00355B7424